MGKKSKLEIKGDLQKKYGQKPKAYAGYVDEPSEKLVLDIFENVATRLGMSPAYLFTIACGEGLSQLYLDEKTSSYYDVNGKLMTDQRMSAFAILGLDFFGSPLEFPRFKKYLPSDYNEGDEYTPYLAERNERYGKELVPSAYFDGLESAIEGIGAVMALKISLFDKKRLSLGYPEPTDDEKAYWYYAYYQAEGDAGRALAANKGFDFLNHQAASSPELHRLCLERVASWRYLLEFEHFTS